MPHGLVTATLNIGGYGFPRRAHIASEAFRHYAHIDVCSFQEMIVEARSAFEQHGLKWIAVEPAANFSNPIAFNPETMNLLQNGTEPISHDGIVEQIGAPRNFAWAEFHHRASGKIVVFVNAHLDNISPQARERGADRIVEFLQGFANHLAIVSGDFNMNVARETDEILLRPYQRMVDAGFVDAYLDAKPKRTIRERTFHSFQGPFTCGEDPYDTYDPDFVFVRGEKVRVANCMPDYFNAGGTWPSDHLWLVTDLELID